MFCLQGNSKMVMLMGILFPNLIKKWLFEFLQRPCHILYLLHHSSSIFVDMFIIFKTPNRALLVMQNRPCKGSIVQEVKCALRDLLLLPAPTSSTRWKVPSPHRPLLLRAGYHVPCLLLPFPSLPQTSCCNAPMIVIISSACTAHVNSSSEFHVFPSQATCLHTWMFAWTSRAFMSRRNLTSSRWYLLILIEFRANSQKPLNIQAFAGRATSFHLLFPEIWKNQ